jgi:SAM-dependent methyltransferase
MKSTNHIDLRNVQAVYSGREGDLWELLMGQQIHIGGFQSSMGLADEAKIEAGMHGVDLACGSGGGIRFLLRYRGVEFMVGVDATEKMIHYARERCQKEGLSKKAEFLLKDVCDTGLSSGSVDFVWGEDAWCYVEDKAILISEAARLVKPGGKIAFTDWIEGATEMTEDEAERYLLFMKFPNILNLQEYVELLTRNGCRIYRAEDTGRFAPYIDLYLDMISMQLTSDALRIINFDMDLLQAMAGEMKFMQHLAQEGKIAQGIFVAQKPA